MPSWTTLLRRPELIEGLYSTPPSLDDFDLSEVSFDAAQNSCSLRGTLSEFPDFPRTGWEDDANRVGIRLRLEGLEEFEIRGWSFENIVHLSIRLLHEGPKIAVSAEGEQTSLQAVCSTLHLEDLFAYHSVEG